MRNKLYVDEFNDKVIIKVYGQAWKKDDNGEVLGLGGPRVKIFQTEVDTTKYDIWSLIIDVDNNIEG